MHTAGDTKGLCTLRYNTNGANKITAFSYLYDDIGKTALQKFIYLVQELSRNHPR
jgi:hypothetical protein